MVRRKLGFSGVAASRILRLETILKQLAPFGLKIRSTSVVSQTDGRTL